MILTTCAACAAPLAHNAPRCVRCKLRYCNAMDIRVTLDDLREAVTALEESERIARRVFGGAHPMAVGVDRALRNSRSVLAARETRQEP